MKKLKLFSSSLCIAAVLAFSIVPTTTVYADDGPQGGSNSTTTKPPPPPPPPKQADILWLILMWLLGLL